jgi:uncharacterized protein
MTAFEWDVTKDAENQCKHGVSFDEARIAFCDPKRMILEDRNHSEVEARYFCIGKAERGIMTVRFTMRTQNIRIIGAGYWRNGKKWYEQKNG